MSENNVRKKQIINFLTITGIVFAAFMLLSVYMGGKDKSGKYQKKIEKFYTATQPQNIIEDWKEKLETENEHKNQQLAAANNKIIEQQQLIDTQNKILQDLQTKVSAIQEAQKILHYQSKQSNNNSNQGGATTKTIANNNNVIDSNPFAISGSFTSEATKNQQAANFPATPVAGDISYSDTNSVDNMQLTMGPEVQHIKLNPQDTVYTADMYVPAGSFVRSMVLGGMMAGAGVESQGEPRPVLLRVLDYSQLPNKIKRNVKDCTIIAAGYGDVSSGRAFIRTDTMSCVMQDNTIFEDKIHAYIAGDDSMSGVQGKVIRNERAMVQNAFITGLLGSGGNAIQQSLGSISTSPLGSVKTASKKDVVANMLAGGLSNSASELQKYFVDLARQHHPVIEVSPGQEVTVVLLKGFKFQGAVR